MKAVAEQLHFKISTLLLHSGKETEAVRWFREHASWYKQMLGPLEGAFLHWAWVSKQFQVFAELLHTSLATASQAPSPSASLQPAVSDRELQPAYYYHVSSVHKIKLASYYCYVCWSYVLDIHNFFSALQLNHFLLFWSFPLCCAGWHVLIQ